MSSNSTDSFKDSPEWTSDVEGRSFHQKYVFIKAVRKSGK